MELLENTLNQDWFKIADFIGIMAFAMSGVILASREKVRFLGALLLATLPAIGGGVIRDLIAGRSPIGLMLNPHYPLVILLVCFVGYFFILLQRSGVIHSFSKPTLFWGFEFFDAVGLSAFTITGVFVAVNMKTDPLWLWGPIFAVTTTIGGGILRDLCRKDRYIEAFQGILYGELSLAWGGFLSVMLLIDKSSSNHVTGAVLISFFGCILSRMMAIYWNVKSPRYYSGEDPTYD